MAFLGPNNVVPINDPSLFKIPGILHYQVPSLGIDEGLFDLTQQPDLTVGQETKQFNFTGHYDILPNVTAVLEGFYTDRTSTEVLNPRAAVRDHQHPGLSGAW